MEYREYTELNHEEREFVREYVKEKGCSSGEALRRVAGFGEC